MHQAAKGFPSTVFVLRCGILYVCANFAYNTMLNIYSYRSRRRFESIGRGGGVNTEKTFVVKTEAIGKSQWNESPYLLANEWICANIAQFLRLPIPPFVIVRKKSRNTAMFISYSFDGDSKPDDVEPQHLYDKFPDACTGIVVFDILVANCDRNRGNIQVDDPRSPQSFYLFDHERALFYIYKGEGIKRLRSRIDRLGVTDGGDSGDEFHCLVELIDSAESISKWLARIRSIPDWFIDEVCEEMWKVSITRTECDFVKSFLKKRRDEIGPLIDSNRHRFPQVSHWPLFV